jgi:hypothetical protein
MWKEWLTYGEHVFITRRHNSKQLLFNTHKTLWGRYCNYLHFIISTEKKYSPNWVCWSTSVIPALMGTGGWGRGITSLRPACATWVRPCFKTNKKAMGPKPGMVVYDCSPSCSIGWGGRIAWIQELETAWTPSKNLSQKRGKPGAGGSRL